jgi:hypothetical protein
MTDDTLRMRAVVVDGYTAPLADLRRQLRGVGSGNTARAVEKDWRGVGKSVTGVANSFQFGVGGALRAVGLGSLAAGVGITALVKGLQMASGSVLKFSGDARGLRLFSDQVGISVKQLQVMKLHTESLGMSWETAQGSLTAFSNNLREVRQHWGEAYNQLRGMNLADLAENIGKAPDTQTALDRALEGIKNIKDPVLQRRVAETLLGTAMWSTVARENYAKMQKEISQQLNALSKETLADADRVAGAKLRLDTEKENTRNNMLSPMLTPLEKGTELYGWGLGKFNKGVGSLNGRRTMMDIQLGQKLQQDETALKSIRALIDEARKSGGGVAPNLLRKEEELVRSVDGLRKALEKATQGGALLQNQSFSGIGLGGGGITAAAYHPGGGLGISRLAAAAGIGRGFGSPEYPNVGDGEAGGGKGGAGGAGAGGYSANPAGAGLGGSEFLKARRQRFAKELEGNPALKKKLAAVLDLENPGAGPAVVESLMNRMDYAGGTIEKGLGINNRGRSFYGPVRRGLDLSRERELERNPRKMVRLMSQIDRALGGSNTVQGHTDQGSAGDPNYTAGGTGVNINRERFNDWGGGPGGHQGARRFREWQQRMVAEGARAPSVAQAPAANTVDLLAQARRAHANSMTHRVEGNASLKIDLNGLPEGSKVKSNFGGMFRQVQVNRGRPMQSVWDSK